MALVATSETMTYIPIKQRCSRQRRRMVYLDECNAVSGASCSFKLVLRLHWHACENMKQNTVYIQIASKPFFINNHITSQVFHALIQKRHQLCSGIKWPCSKPQVAILTQIPHLGAQTCTQAPARAAWRSPVRGPDMTIVTWRRWWWL
jgi:hypothetical protein